MVACATIGREMVVGCQSWRAILKNTDYGHNCFFFLRIARQDFHRATDYKPTFRVTYLRMSSCPEGGKIQYGSCIVRNLHRSYRVDGSRHYLCYTNTHLHQSIINESINLQSNNWLLTKNNSQVTLYGLLLMRVPFESVKKKTEQSYCWGFGKLRVSKPMRLSQLMSKRDVLILSELPCWFCLLHFCKNIV